jgi:hypothetical protein
LRAAQSDLQLAGAIRSGSSKGDLASGRRSGAIGRVLAPLPATAATVACACKPRTACDVVITVYPNKKSRRAVDSVDLPQRRGA